MPKEIKIEGERSKSFHIYYTDIDDRPHTCEVEYDTVEEVQKHRYRLDRRYKIRVGGKFMTRKEFDEWAKSQK
jgi:hypothetical protein